MQLEVKSLLVDMQHAGAGIALFTERKSLDDYKSDLMLRSAVERQFEIIGEAMTRLRKLAPDLVERFSEYRGIINLRNVLIHGYDAVDNDITWKIIVNELPVLRREVDELLKLP